jgi:Glycosyl transferase family 2
VKPNPGSSPSLTFIIPAYNAQGTLADTLSSLREQTIPDWRAIVVDDGSTDRTTEVAREFGDPRVAVHSQANRGLAGARNAGLLHAFGLGTPHDALVCFLDADDTIAPRYSEAMIEALGDHDIVACGYEFMSAANEPLGWIVRPAPHDASLERLIEFNPFIVTCVARLASLRRLGTMPSPPARPGDIFDEQLRVQEDWDLWLRATAAGLRWAPTLDEPLFRYRCSMGLTRHAESMWTTGITVLSRAQVDPALKASALRRWSLRSAAIAVANGDHQLASRILGPMDKPSDDDIATIAAALGWAFQRAHVVPPSRVNAHYAAWRAGVQRAFVARPWLPRLLARFDTTNFDWASAAGQIVSGLQEGEVPTIYGMGWNGQTLLAELTKAYPAATIAWIDDHPAAAVPASLAHRATRLTIADLDAHHAVIVTPGSQEPILSRLASTRARVLWPSRSAHAA